MSKQLCSVCGSSLWVGWVSPEKGDRCINHIEDYEEGTNALYS